MIIKSFTVSGVGGVPEPTTTSLTPVTQVVKEPNRAGKTRKLMLLEYALTHTLPAEVSLDSLLYRTSTKGLRPASIAIELLQPRSSETYTLKGEIDAQLKENWSLQRGVKGEVIASGMAVYNKLSELMGGESITNIGAKIVIPSLLSRSFNQFREESERLTYLTSVDKAIKLVDSALRQANKEIDQSTEYITSSLRAEAKQKWNVDPTLSLPKLVEALGAALSSMTDQLSKLAKEISEKEGETSKLRAEADRLAKDSRSLTEKSHKAQPLREQANRLEQELQAKEMELSIKRSELERTKKSIDTNKADLAHFEEQQGKKLSSLKDVGGKAQQVATNIANLEASTQTIAQIIRKTSDLRDIQEKQLRSIESDIKVLEQSHGKFPPELLNMMEREGLLDRPLTQTWRKISTGIESLALKLDGRISSLKTELRQTHSEEITQLLNILLSLAREQPRQHAPTQEEQKANCTLCTTEITQPPTSRKEGIYLFCPFCGNQLGEDSVHHLITVHAKQLSSLKSQVEQLEDEKRNLRRIDKDTMDKFLRLQDALALNQGEHQKTIQELERASATTHRLEEQIRELKADQTQMQYTEKATKLNQEMDEIKSTITRLQATLDHDSTQVGQLEIRIKTLEKESEQAKSQLQVITKQIRELLPEHEVTEYERLRKQEEDNVRKSQSTLMELADLRAKEGEITASRKELAEASQITDQHVQRLSTLNNEKENLIHAREALIALRSRQQHEAQELFAKGIVDVLKNLNIVYNGIVREDGETYLLMKDHKNRDLAKVRFQELSESEIINLVVSLAIKGDVWSRTNDKELKTFILDDARALDGEAKKNLSEVLTEAMNCSPQLAFFEPEF